MSAIRPIEADTPAISPLARKSCSPTVDDAAPAKAGTSARAHHHHRAFTVAGGYSWDALEELKLTGPKRDFSGGPGCSEVGFPVYWRPR